MREIHLVKEDFYDVETNEVSPRLVEVVSNMLRLTQKVSDNQDLTTEEEVYYRRHINDMIEYHLKCVDKWASALVSELEITLNRVEQLERDGEPSDN